MNKNTRSRGFTFIEMLVSVSIFAVISAVVLYSNSGFSNNVLVTNLAYEVALTLRQAQTFGLSSVGQNIGGQMNYRVGYGVHFDITEGKEKSFVFFSDSIEEDKLYTDSGDEVCGTGENECQQKIIINGSNRIESLCVKYPDDPDTLDCEVDTLDVVFKRPQVEAYILANGNNELELTTAIINLISPQGRQKMVTVESSGQISISDPTVSDE